MIVRPLVVTTAMPSKAGAIVPTRLEDRFDQVNPRESLADPGQVGADAVAVVADAIGNCAHKRFGRNSEDRPTPTLLPRFFKANCVRVVPCLGQDSRVKHARGTRPVLRVQMDDEAIEPLAQFGIDRSVSGRTGASRIAVKHCTVGSVICQDNCSKHPELRHSRASNPRFGDDVASAF